MMKLLTVHYSTRERSFCMKRGLAVVLSLMLFGGAIFGTGTTAQAASVTNGSYVKGDNENNPLVTQNYGADPGVLVYNDTVYIYTTNDTQEFAGNNENTYGKINTLNCYSSKDMVNWTDHGSFKIAGSGGAAKWASNSWAPCIATKKINGKDKFFLYFANSGNGIAVLSSDSPTGPFVDPIGGPLVSRDTPNCASVTWLFDPAVLVDDDGTGWLYIGGGVPSEDKASNPGTARVVRLTDDMIGLAEDPKPIENVAYLFEDSGINKINGKYYYSYCSNFNVTPEATEKLGFESGEILTMVSDKPDGPFVPSAAVLKNPGFFFGRGGNNHHCMFEFNGEYYITYHSRILEESMGILKGYRCTGVDKLVLNDKNEPAASTATREGVEQLKNVDPYVETKAVTMSNAAGIATRQYGEEAVKYGSGDMIVTNIRSGGWIQISGVDFGAEPARLVEVKVKRAEGRAADKIKGKILVCLDAPESRPLEEIEISMDPVIGVGTKEGLLKISNRLDTQASGIHDLYFVFEGEGYEFYSWKFVE